MSTTPSPSSRPPLNRFQLLALITVLATLLLIFVGGLVRASGAGLGCPDWPKCFGVWIPPTTAADLPPGWDPALFNPLHTWMEYVNRLVGVVIGLLITATMLVSLTHARRDPVLPAASAAAFILVLFQAWLGGQVVCSGLAGGMITLHMLLAMVIVNMLLYAAWRGWKDRLRADLDEVDRRVLRRALIALLALTLAQMVLGTQVREMVDAVKNGPVSVPREMWLDAESTLFLVHRSGSWLVLLVAGFFWWRARKTALPAWARRMADGLFALVLLQIALGVGLERLGMPGAMQVLHLTGVAVLICLEFALILALSPRPVQGAAAGSALKADPGAV